MPPIAGRLVTDTFKYDGGRQVTACVPPAPPEASVFAGAVLDPLGRRIARCARGRCHDQGRRVAWRLVLEGRVPADGGVGVWRLSIAVDGWRGTGEDILRN
jgi:hypothetical protein